MADKPLQAVILAGGQGTRLRPLTLARAKPVVPLLNRPFLAFQLALLRAHGVTDVILACSYRVDDVRTALGDASQLGVRLRYVVEKEPLGTGGGVKNAADLVAGTVFVFNGDVLTDVDLSAMQRFHAERDSRATIFLTRVTDPRQYGLVELDADSRLARFREKPAATETITTDTVNAGVYLLDAALIRRIPGDRPVSIEREFFPALIADRVPSYGWCAPAYWRDIGSPAAYREAQMDLLEGRARMLLAPAGAWDGGSWRAAGGSAASDARVVPPAVLGARVTLHPRCQVGPGAVLWERVEVGAGAVLRECVIGADVKIGTHARVGAGIVLESGAVIPERATLAR